MTKKLDDGRTINCPAGEPAKLGCGVFCKIEGKILMTKGGEAAAIDAKGVKLFCAGEFRNCPSFQLANEMKMDQQQASAALQRAQDKKVDADSEVLEEYGVL